MPDFLTDTCIKVNVTNLLALLLNCSRHHLLQVFPGLLSPLVDELGLAFGLRQLLLNTGHLFRSHLGPVLLQELFGAADDVVQGSGVGQHVLLQGLGSGNTTRVKSRLIGRRFGERNSSWNPWNLSWAYSPSGHLGSKRSLGMREPRWWLGVQSPPLSPSAIPGAPAGTAAGS